MHITDPIADMLTRIRNANSAKHDTVKIPASNMKKAIAQILLDEGYIKGFKVEDDGKQGVIGYEGKEHVIHAGENFRFARGGKHYVRADKRFKMALFLTLE